MYTLGKHAIWHDNSFTDLFFDGHLPLTMPPLPTSRLTPHRLKSLHAPIHFLTTALQRVLNAPREILSCLHSHDMNQLFTLLERFNDLKELSEKLPTPGSELFNQIIHHGTGAKEKPQPPDVDALFLDFLTFLTAKIRSMNHNDVLLLPGGWIRPKPATASAAPTPTNAASKDGGDASATAAATSGAVHGPSVTNPSIDDPSPTHDYTTGHVLFYILERRMDVFSLTVVNTGNVSALNGLEYHPVTYTGVSTSTGGLEGGSPKLKYQHGLILEGVPISRIIDSSFWFLLYTPMVYPSEEKSCASFIYERVLPFLNHRPILNNGIRSGPSTLEEGDNNAASPTVDTDLESRLATQQQKTLEAWGSRDGNPNSAARSMSLIPDWQARPLRGDPTCVHALLYALKYALGLKLNSFSKAMHVVLLLRWEMVRIIGEDLRRVHTNEYIDSEHRLVRLATQVFGMHCGAEGAHPYSITPARLLLEMKATIDAINGRSDELTALRLQQARKTDFDTVDSTEMSLLPTPLTMLQHKVAYEPFPLFDRFSRSDDIEGLAGGAPPPPIFRPIQFTLIPKVCKNYTDVQLALRHADHICTLLSYQDRTIKNTYLHRLSLLTHVFTRVIPLPMPWNHPKKLEHCFWTQPIRYSDQIDIMRSLNRCCQHYVSCALSVHVTRAFDAARVLTMSCMAVVADTLMRCVAADVPSRLCLHFAGVAQVSATAPFKVLPFGFDIFTTFVSQSQVMEFTDPNLVTIRTKVLDYFHQQNQWLQKDHILFDWEKSDEGGGKGSENLSRLFSQICYDMGFPEENLPLYLSGEQTEIIDFYPELRYYRDIIFYFKYMMAPTQEAFPTDTKSYHLKDAKLRWTYTGAETGFQVHAFDNMRLRCLDEDVKAKAAAEADERAASGGFLKSIFAWFFTSQTRAPPSGADPSALLGDVKAVVKSEEDILHIRPLPDFNGALTQRDSELLLSYLTVPYLRIPLILGFFSAPERISALGNKRLRQVVDGCLFEPGLWQEIDQKVQPDVVPAPDRAHLATVNGLLFNELIHSPQGILAPIQRMLELALDLDTGKFSYHSSQLILYVVRLTVRVESYMNFLVENYQWKNRSGAGAVLNGVESRSFIRGLTDAISESQVHDLAASATALRTILNRHVFPMVERWSELAIKHNLHNQICLLQAHLAFIYHNTPEEKMNRHIASTHLCAQIVLTARYQFTSLNGRAWHDKRQAAHERELAKFRANPANRNKDPNNVLTVFSLEIPETSLFDIWSRQRNKVLNFLDRHPEQSNQVMEAVVRVITMTGTRTKKYATSSNADHASSLIGPAASLGTAEMTIRKWRSMRGRNNKGRFIPDMVEELTPEEQQKRDEYDQAVAEEEAERGHGRLAVDEAASDSDAQVAAAAAASKDEQGTIAPSTSAAHSESTVPQKGGFFKAIGGAVSSLLSSQKPAPRPKPTLRGPITIDGFAISSPSEAIIEESDQVLDTEINIQLGDFTLKSSRLEVLNEHLPLGDYADYTSIFGKHVDSTPMQCAEVRHTTHRKWFRLVGRRHDVLYWDADRREPQVYPDYTRRYASDSEGWIVKALEPIRAKYLAGMEIFLPAEWYPDVAPYAMLQGLSTRSVEERPPPTGVASKDRDAPNVTREYATLHEIVVFQKQRVVHVYTVHEHGRRYYRTLKFVSDARFSLCNLSIQIPRLVKTKKWEPFLRYSALIQPVNGQFEQHVHAKPSLVITRNLSVTKSADQMYVPPKFLMGIVPSALLDHYEFWQNPDDSMTGYPVLDGDSEEGTFSQATNEAASTAETAAAASNTKSAPHANFIVHIEFLRPPTTATPGAAYNNWRSYQKDRTGFQPGLAKIQRIPIVDPAILAKNKRNRETVAGMFDAQAQDAADAGEEGAVPSHLAQLATVAGLHHGFVPQYSKAQTLLNLLYAPPDSALGLLADQLLRLENLSHILVWSNTPASKVEEHTFMFDANLSIDVIELPRLSLNFEMKPAPIGMTNRADVEERLLFSKDHIGLFLSNRLDHSTVELLAGIPNGLILENLDSELFLLVPSTIPIRPLVGKGWCATTIVFDHFNSSRYLESLEVKHYLYPIHLSSAFLFTPSLNAALYLLNLKILHRQYDQIFALIDSCVTDTQLTPEEAFIFSQLRYFTAKADSDPNAHAVRLKLSLVSMETPLAVCSQQYWDIGRELESYILKHDLVHANCRLTIEEEMRLIEDGVEVMSTDILNRLRYLQYCQRMNDAALRQLGGDSARNTNGQLSAFKFGRFDSLNPVLTVVLPTPSLTYAFDAFTDASFLDPSTINQLTEKFLNMSYTRPKEVSGIDAIRDLKEWLCIGTTSSHPGLKLKGGKHDLGFLFFFELMTSTLKFQILKEDSTYALGSLLMRMMPPKETNDTNALMSLLRLMSLNPQIVMEKSFPRWKDTRTFKLSVVFAKQGVFAELFKSCRTFLEERRDKKEIINSVGVEVDMRAPLIAGPMPQQIFYERCWISASSTSGADVSCSKRYLSPTVDTLDDLVAFTTIPLAPIGLSRFLVHKSRADRGLPLVTPKFPIDLSNHKAMDSHVAQSMMARLRDDIKYYAETENAKYEPFIATMTEELIKAMVHTDSTANAGLDAAINQVRAILNALADLQKKDRDTIQQTLTRTLILSNKVDIALPTQSSGVSLSAGVHDVEAESKARNGAGILLSRIAGAEPTITFELLVASLLNSNAHITLQKLNPYLKSEDVAQILDMTTSIVMHCSRLGHSHRAVSAARDLLAALMRLRQSQQQRQSTRAQAAASSTPEFDTELASRNLTTFQSLYSQSQSLAQLLVMKRYFITSEPTDTGSGREMLLAYDPRFLVFEFTHNILLRRSQVHLINQFMKRVSDGKCMINQMIMGMGKTTVVGPLLALLLADGKSLVIQVVPRALLEFSRSVMRSRFSAIVRKHVYTFQFDRFSEITPTLYRKMVKARSNKSVIMTTPNALKSFALNLCHLHVNIYD